MIRINFAKEKAAKSSAPGKSRALPRIQTPGKNTFYVIAFIAAIGLLFFSYMQEIADYFYGSPPPMALVPKPIQPVPQQVPPDSEQITSGEDSVPAAGEPVTQAPTEPVEEPAATPVRETEEQPAEKPAEEPVQKPRETPPPPRQAAPEPTQTIIMSGSGVSISSQVSAYLAMRNALPPEKIYSLLAVEGGSFTSEISASSQDMITRYNENLRSQLPGSVPRVQHGLSFDDPAKKRAIISGKYRTSAPEARQNVQERTPDDIIRRLWTVARRHGFTLTGKNIGASFASNGVSRTPLLLKFTGNESATPEFLAALKREPLNVELEKIAGVPRRDGATSTIQLALNFLVVQAR